jgi:hypothetical protein
VSSDLTPVADILDAYKRRIARDADVAQPVEHPPCKREVAGSTPAVGSIPPTADLSVPVAAENPMRVLSRMQCAECGHDWTQPAAGGLCARCHSTDTRCVSQRVCVNRRV